MRDSRPTRGPASASRNAMKLIVSRCGADIALALWLVVAATAVPTQAQAAAAAHPLLPYQMNVKSMGVVNCANSLCHGAVQPWEKANVLQNEYVTWSRVDKHARSYKILFNEQSTRIARTLGLGRASEAKICLACHTHYVAAERRGEGFELDDGVSCEACHGPSEHWLPKHVEDGATHAGNLAAGLYPTDDPVQRARLCLSCHFGNGDRFVTHRIMGAGHPRMSFELDT